VASVATPDPAPLEHAAEELRQRGIGAGLATLLRDIRARLAHGEFGALPVVVGLAGIWTFFQIQEPAFLTARNLSNLILQIAVVGTIAIGLVLVLLLGEIDLSVGSLAGLCAAVLGVLIVNHGWPWWGAIVAMLAVGAASGAFQGAWIALLRVPSFVVTLAGLLAWLGVQLRVLGDAGTLNVFDQNILNLTTSYLADAWGWLLALGLSVAYAATHLITQALRRRAGLAAQPVVVVIARTLGLAAVLFAGVAVLNSATGVPTAGVILLGLVILFQWLTTRTKFGRCVYAIGGNAEAARRAGIKVGRIRIYVFMLAGLFAAVGGLLSVSRLAAASTQTGGGTLLLEAIAAAVIGGTSLFGGRGYVWSALLGALVIGSVSNGLDLLAQPPEVKYMVQGAILLLAVTIDAVSRRAQTSP